MTMQALKQMTAVETAILTHFESQQSELSGAASARCAAITAFKQNGLPTRRVEAWHYTDLRAALTAFDGDEIDSDTAPAKPLVSTQSAGSTGFNMAKFSPDHVNFSFHGDDDTIGQINAAFANNGLMCSIDGQAKFDVPLEFVTQINGGSKHNRHTIEVNEKAEVIFVERQLGVDGFGTAVTNLTIKDEAQVTYVIVQQTSTASTHLGQINVSLGANSKFLLFLLNAGGKLVRQEVRVSVNGEGADFQLRSVNLIGDDQHIDVTMDLDHRVANTTSQEIIRNIVTGKGKGVFQGKIAVNKIAQKTDAKMACNTLLLSDEGDFSSKPELEIFADDVACGHGATFTDIEPAHMFYLMSRGICERDARNLLIKGFVDEIVEDVAHQDLCAALVHIIDDWLDANA